MPKKASKAVETQTHTFNKTSCFNENLYADRTTKELIISYNQIVKLATTLIDQNNPEALLTGAPRKAAAIEQQKEMLEKHCKFLFTLQLKEMQKSSLDKKYSECQNLIDTFNKRKTRTFLDFMRDPKSFIITANERISLTIFGMLPLLLGVCLLIVAVAASFNPVFFLAGMSLFISSWILIPLGIEYIRDRYITRSALARIPSLQQELSLIQVKQKMLSEELNCMTVSIDSKPVDVAMLLQPSEHFEELFEAPPKANSNMADAYTQCSL